MDIRLIATEPVINAIAGITWFNPCSSKIIPLLATTAADSPIVLASVLLSLVVIYLASTIGGELCARMNLPPVLGQLLGGLVVGISAFHLLIFPDGGGDSTNSLMMAFLETTAGLSLDRAAATFQTDGEVISILAEIGVVILLFEIGLESDLKSLLKVGTQAAIVAVVGVVTPFVSTLR